MSSASHPQDKCRLSATSCHSKFLSLNTSRQLTSCLTALYAHTGSRGQTMGIHRAATGPWCHTCDLNQQLLNLCLRESSTPLSCIRSFTPRADCLMRCLQALLATWPGKDLEHVVVPTSKQVKNPHMRGDSKVVTSRGWDVAQRGGQDLLENLRASQGTKYDALRNFRLSHACVYLGTPACFGFSRLLAKGNGPTTNS